MTPPNLHSIPGAPHNPKSPDRATTAATAAYAARFASGFGSEFFRPTTLGLIVSSLGAGSYLGGCSDEDDRAYEDTIAEGFARGINFVDTAPNYRAQRSERSLGTALRRAIAAGVIARPEVVICTKGGYIALDGNIPATREEYQQYLRRVLIEPGIVREDEIVAGGHSIAPRFLRYSIALSRQNLGVRTLDVYLLHNPEQQLGAVTIDALRVRVRSAFTALEEAVGRGDIGCYGCATWNAFRVAPGSPGYLSLSWFVDVAKEVAGVGHHFRAIQLPINLGMPEGIRESLQKIGQGSPVPAVRAANDLGLMVIASAALMQGRLSSGLPDGVRELFPNHRTDAQRALGFVRGLPGVATALVGMRSTEHLVENLEVAEMAPRPAQ